MMHLPTRPALDGAISYEVVCHCIGRSALQSTTSHDNQEIHTILLIWTDWNGKLYGKDYDEQQAIALETTRAEVEQIYEGSKHYVNDSESAILHARPLEQI
jgi:hypothetical protein